MAKKKVLIYLLTFVVFVGFLTLYTVNVIRTTNTTDEQKILDTIEISEMQIQRNIEYIAKGLQLELSEQKINNEHLFSDFETAAESISEMDAYLLSSEGVLYQPGGVYDQRKVDRQVMRRSDEDGYGVFSISQTKSAVVDVGILIPVSQQPYYFVRVIKAEHFLTRVTENIHVSDKTWALFDEWGNQISTLAESDNKTARIREKAVEYANDPVNNQYQKAGFNQEYSVYFKIPSPEAWFLGNEIKYTNPELSFAGIPEQTMLIFGMLVLMFCVIIALDVINDRDKKKELFRVSNVDHLTKLTNSTGLEEALPEYMHKYPLLGYDFICMDIAAFSRINTMFGYSTGDMVLCTIANVIKERYLCGIRVNADCFAFFVKHSDDVIEMLETSFYDAVEKQMGHEYNQMLVFKFGLYPLTDNKVAWREVYNGAMLALKDAKKQRRKNQVTFDDNLKNDTDLKRNIEINMMHALSKEEFVVYVQPQLGIPKEEGIRGETLIRWQSEFMGFLPPDKFIPIFERNGFVVETDFFMLASALDFLQKQIKTGERPITLAVNQSKVTITFPNYYERLKALVEQYDVPLKYIELEVTESTLENDWEKIVPLIHSLKRLGFSIAMDDFGSGFSSLNTLRILPIDVLKIDRTFLYESDSSDRSKIIINNIIRMSKELNIKVVCEGVETKEQLEFLKEAKCDIIQGYYYSRPIPLEKFAKEYLPQNKSKFFQDRNPEES